MNAMNYRLEEPKLMNRGMQMTLLYIFSTTPEGLNNLVQAVNKLGALPTNVQSNAAKTKIMELDKRQEKNTNIVINNINVERVQSFQYISWRNVYHKIGDGASNIKQRLAMAVER